MENEIIFDYDERKQKYYVIKDFYDSSIKEYILHNDIKGVLVSRFHGFDLPDIEFLGDFVYDVYGKMRNFTGNPLMQQNMTQEEV